MRPTRSRIQQSRRFGPSKEKQGEIEQNTAVPSLKREITSITEAETDQI
jgi:hypothetical protein